MILLQSQLVSKTRREAPKDEVSTNAQLLTRAGYVDKVMAGVYTYLPLGLRILRKIQTIIREEMDALGAQEILMPALTPKEGWVATGRWDTLDVLFKLEGASGKEYALGSTHEEVVTPLMQNMVQSYKDLPKAVYQIQDKFRNEPRAKSGVLRGREFNMKDLYSFHMSQGDLDAFYEKATAAYHRIFQRVGLDAKLVEASGGSFSAFSHEFQVFTPYGEDLVYECPHCATYKNREIVHSPTCPVCSAELIEHKAIEVGNIFRLGTRFSDAFNFSVLDGEGNKQPVLMGCYGIGPSRVLGTIVEVHHDDQGIAWPNAVAPFDVHVVSLSADEAVLKKAKEIALILSDHGKDVLLDDRDVRAGEKFADSDLIGIPVRVVISERLVQDNSVEIKERSAQAPVILGEASFLTQWGM